MKLSGLSFWCWNHGCAGGSTASSSRGNCWSLVKPRLSHYKSEYCVSEPTLSEQASCSEILYAVYCATYPVLYSVS